MNPSIAVIDISLLNTKGHIIAKEIHKACTQHGFFYITGHGISLELQNKLEYLSSQFFQLDEDEKMKISMQKGGKAWRCYFPLNGELTSGKPDLKEGIYFGTE